MDLKKIKQNKQLPYCTKQSPVLLVLVWEVHCIAWSFIWTAPQTHLMPTGKCNTAMLPIPVPCDLGVLRSHRLRTPGVEGIIAKKEHLVSKTSMPSQSAIKISSVYSFVLR